MFLKDTIAAIATPPGKGGVGIIRVSGSKVSQIIKELIKKPLQPRHALFCNFFEADNSIIDQGIALFFSTPNSFTGEDVLELQGHGGPVILDCLLTRLLQLGARLAKPGEFSERAFLNGKINLTEAESIADLINAATTASAHAAVNSLRGEFSREINNLFTLITNLRMYVEAAIDFSDEDISFLRDEKIILQLAEILETLEVIKTSAKQGMLLQEGINVVIAGKPNAGKSSLLNYLTGEETAIVTEIPGTTRDILRAQIQIDGIPLHILDTAGLRESHDVIEQEGIKRAKTAIKQADCILLIVDAKENASREPKILAEEFLSDFSSDAKLIIVFNKIDLTAETESIQKINDIDCVFLSLKNNIGLPSLKQILKNSLGFNNINGNNFSARRRHLEALEKTKVNILNAKKALHAETFELMAEDLRLAGEALGEITGKFTTEDLLNKIFSEFCIGK